MYLWVVKFAKKCKYILAKKNIYIYTKLIYFDHLEMKTLRISINKNKNNATFTTLTSLFELFHNIIS